MKERLKNIAYPSHPLFDIFHQFWTAFHQQIGINGSRTKILIPEAALEKLREMAQTAPPIPLGVIRRQSPVKCARVPRAVMQSKKGGDQKISPFILKKPQDMSDVNLEVTAAALLVKAEDKQVSAVSFKGQSQALDLCRLVF